MLARCILSLKKICLSVSLGTCSLFHFFHLTSFNKKIFKKVLTLIWWNVYQSQLVFIYNNAITVINQLFCNKHKHLSIGTYIKISVNLLELLQRQIQKMNLSNKYTPISTFSYWFYDNYNSWHMVVFTPERKGKT